MENVTDGWYIDLDTSVSCDPPRQPGAFAVLVGGRNGKADYPTFKFVGQRETGFALATTRNSTLPPAVIPSEPTRRALRQFSSESLSPALFEIPSGFREVREVRRRAVMPWWGRALISLHATWSRLESVLTRPFHKFPSGG
jgi:hypothetical protein